MIIQLFGFTQIQENLRYSINKKKAIKFQTKSSKIEDENEDISQDEIDKILDKISDSGYSSLSKKEKEKLFNASKK